LPETDPAAQVLSTAQVLIDITTMQRRNWQWLHRPLESTLALAMQHLQMPWEHSHWCTCTIEQPVTAGLHPWADQNDADWVTEHDCAASTVACVAAAVRAHRLCTELCTLCTCTRLRRRWALLSSVGQLGPALSNNSYFPGVICLITDPTMQDAAKHCC